MPTHDADRPDAPALPAELEAQLAALSEILERWREGDPREVLDELIRALDGLRSAIVLSSGDRRGRGSRS